MSSVGSSNISFSGLRTAWGNARYVGGSDPGASNISLSEFRGATFTSGSGDTIPASGSISISDFASKTFGSSGGGGGKSDRFLKRDIIYIGKSSSDIPLYTWFYIDGYGLDTQNRYEGTIAQDLLEMGLDEAVIPKDENGFLGVDYTKIPDVSYGIVKI